MVEMRLNALVFTLSQFTANSYMYLCASYRLYERYISANKDDDVGVVVYRWGCIPNCFMLSSYLVFLLFADLLSLHIRMQY